MYIQLRNNIYHFRLKVPTKYRKRVGKREIRQSLNTGDKQEAQRQAIVLAGKFMAEFEQYSCNDVSPRNHPKLSECFDLYLAEQKLQEITAQTINNKQSVINRLLNIVGDFELEEYDRAAAKLYRREILATGISIVTFNNNLKNINAFWHWAIAEGYTQSSPFKKLSMRDKRHPSTIGKAFTPDDLERLFSKASYPREKSSYKYWLPLLALHTGARLKELAQIYLDDIITIDRLPCIVIQAKHSDQRIKNKSSERTIPIHPTLINNRFLDYVDELKIIGEQRLFPEIPFHSIHGYSNTPSKWWATYMTSRGFARNTGANFHSFRHTVANKLKQQGVEERYIAALLGHSAGGITHNRYGKQYEPAVLKPIIKQLQFDLPAIQINGRNI